MNKWDTTIIALFALTNMWTVYFFC